MDNTSDEKDDEQEGSSWVEVQRHRNRVNSQKTRNREREQTEYLKNQRTMLYLSNTALQYQNAHMREAIQKIKSHFSKSPDVPIIPPARDAGTTMQQAPSFQNSGMLPPAIPAGMAPMQDGIPGNIPTAGLPPPTMASASAVAAVASQLPPLEQQIFQQLLSQWQQNNNR